LEHQIPDIRKKDRTWARPGFIDVYDLQTAFKERVKKK